MISLRIGIAICLGALTTTAALAAEPIDAAHVARAVASVRATLKDPGSALFENVTGSRNASLPQDAGGVCGYVNAKNGYGGYAGRMVFAVAVGDDGTPGWTTVGKDSLYAGITKARCKAWGAQIDAVQ